MMSKLDISMYLELYTQKEYMHDDIECSKFAETCLCLLKSNGLINTNEKPVKSLNCVKGKTLHEIDKEKYNELFMAVK